VRGELDYLQNPGCQEKGKRGRKKSGKGWKNENVFEDGPEGGSKRKKREGDIKKATARRVQTEYPRPRKMGCCSRTRADRDVKGPGEKGGPRNLEKENVNLPGGKNRLIPDREKGQKKTRVGKVLRPSGRGRSRQEQEPNQGKG